MSGQIKAGLGTLIGNAGEYYVVAELLKRGVIAALAPRNSPAFDILATKDSKTVRIRVKTKSEQYDLWQWAVKKNGMIFRDIGKKYDFTVLVNLAMDHRDMKFFVIPTHLLNKWLMKDFEKWLNTPGKRGQQRSSSNPKRNLLYTRYKAKIEKYKNNWDILWE